MNAWRALESAEQTAHANSLVDKIIEGGAAVARERGATMLALGERQSVRPVTWRRIQEYRHSGDRLWHETHTLAQGTAAQGSIGADLDESLERAAQAYAALQRVRQRVDDDLRHDRRDDVHDFELFDAATNYIDVAERLSEYAANAVLQPGQAFLHGIHLKRYASTVSEYTGRERALFAYYTGGRQPMPATRLDEIKIWRGITIRSADHLLSLAGSRQTSSAVRNSITSMLREYETRFEPDRQAMYSAIVSKEYPMTGDAWMASATRAIDAALNVIRIVTAEVNATMRQQIQYRRQQLILLLMLAAFSLFLAGISIIWVRRVANALYHEKELAETTLHSIGDAVITTDGQGNVNYLNPIAEALTGWSVKEAMGRQLTEIFNICNGLTREMQASPVEKCLRENRIVGLENNTVLISRHGHERVIEDSAAPVHDRKGNVVGAVLVFYDVTAMRQSQHLLSHHATHDALTGLINRREFERRLKALVESAKVEDLRHVLLYMDLDQFRLINDTCGHVAGDKLLRQLAFLLMNRIRSSDTVARLGGDEFGVLLDNCQIEPGLRVANDLVRLVKEFRFVWQGTVFEISASIGVSEITPESESPVALLSQADAACYAAKDKGRNRIHAYQPDDAEMLQRKGEMQWVPRIRAALAEDRFVLYCQKILPLRPGLKQSRYCEILLRMVDEDNKIVLPMGFIPSAERFDLMAEIDRWVIRRALATVGKAQSEIAAYQPRCFINLSAASLMDETMPAFIEEQFRASGIPGDGVCFEITETEAVANLEIAMAFMNELRMIGCRFALDDFGRGMSSFGYLRNLPVDYLKIDGEFIQNLDASPTDCAMVDAINRVGHVMGLKTIAEFVKDEGVLRKLRELGVDFAQGFHISMPEPMSSYLRNADGR